MKKLTICMVTALLLFSSMGAQMNETDPSVAAIDASTTVQEAQAEVLLTRLHEINSMDKTNLNASEKKELRKEVRTIESALRELGGGVYISVGAIIIILLLLILLL
ncbi:MAG: hypothetical protein SH856_14870 [Flavobacteriales bacterium]|nr:hypothetical protein [Flavobacteriales bacterium]